MRANRLLVIGSYGAGNLGDDAIFAGLQALLKKLKWKGELFVTHGGHSSSKEIYAKAIHVDLKPLKPFKAHSFPQVDLAIMGGGGLFVDTEGMKVPLFWSRQMPAKTPLILIGQSLGPLKHLSSRKITKWALKKAEAIQLRDPLSLSELAKLKLKGEAGTDLALHYLKTLPKPKRKKNTLILSLRNWDSDTNQSWQPILKAAKALAKKHKLKLKILAMDLKNQEEIKKLKATKLEVLTPQSAEEAYKHFASSKLVISMRLHASLFAVAAETPTLALSYSSKVQGLFTSLNLQDGFAMTKTKGLTAKEIKELAEPLLGHKPQTKWRPLLRQNQDFLARQLAQH